MSIITASNLHRLTTLLYGVVVPGHIWMGYEKVYPALAYIPTAQFDIHSGRVGARSAWDLVTTSVVVAAALHWKWARRGASDSIEENLAMLALTGHLMWNGIQYLRIKEAPAGPLLVITSAIGIAASALDLLAQVDRP